MTIFATNKKAFFDYEILDTLEAGIVLKGYEVASVKRGKISLTSSYAIFHNNELMLTNANISTYQPKNQPANYLATQSRKLLVSKSQILKLKREIKEKNITLIPLKIYVERKKIKVEIGLGRGKKKYDKRETIKKREINRKIKKIMG
jgi:SsrA-binding protein